MEGQICGGWITTTAILVDAAGQGPRVLLLVLEPQRGLPEASVACGWCLLPRCSQLGATTSRDRGGFLRSRRRTCRLEFKISGGVFGLEALLPATVPGASGPAQNAWAPSYTTRLAGDGVRGAQPPIRPTRSSASAGHGVHQTRRAARRPSNAPLSITVPWPIRRVRPHRGHRGGLLPNLSGTGALLESSPATAQTFWPFSRATSRGGQRHARPPRQRTHDDALQLSG